MLTVLLLPGLGYLIRVTTEWMVRDKDTAWGTTPCSLAVDFPPRNHSLWSLDHYGKVRRRIPGCDCKGMAVDAEYGIINAGLINRSMPRLSRWVDPPVFPGVSQPGWLVRPVSGARVAPCPFPHPPPTGPSHQQLMDADAISLGPSR